MMLLVQLVQDRTSAEIKGKGAGSLSSISDSVDHAMEVDGNGACIRNPKADSYVPKFALYPVWSTAQKISDWHDIIFGDASK